MTITLATWNTDWITSRSDVSERAAGRIQDLSADLLVLTEVTQDLIPREGDVLLGGEDWGYPYIEGRRKVVLWSRWPIENPLVDQVEPPSRHVAATIGTPGGPVRVHAVCVPWRDAHVRTGRKDSQPWQEHLDFLASLATLLTAERRASTTDGTPRILLGDMNQRGGRYPYRSQQTRQAWEGVLDREGLTVCTPDEVVDKIALGLGLEARDTWVLPPDGISDHHAVAAAVNLA